MYELRDKVKGGWRVVKGWANPSPLTTPVFIGVSGEKVKGKIESKVFPGQNTLPAVGKHIPNGDGRPPENFLPTHHFMPGNGKKLPQ